MAEDDVPTVVPREVPPQDAETMPGGEGTFPGRDSLGGAYGSPPKPLPGRGAKVGGHVVLERLGAGAMGVVLLAVDPELDRRVAIKLLTVGGQTPTAQARLLREARSAARLQHPNVVAVHQAGTHDEQVFVVMEYVDGGTFREWMEREPRTWEQILDVVCQAGEGLAAAHAKGFVHRDFKPDNVLVDREGRARVSDFGLVSQAGESIEVTEPGRDESVDPRLTRTGSVLGTPAYMSPEQMRGGTLDERSDQFSFCITLYEALWGERPFGGDTLATLAASLEEAPEEPPRSEVPSHVRAAVLRGLSHDPEDRHPSMRALLQAMAGRERKRGTVAVAGAAAVVAASVAAVVASRDDVAEAPAGWECPAAPLDPVWGESARERMIAALTESGHPRGEQTAQQLAGVLDTWTTKWQTSWDGACESAERGDKTRAALTVQHSCLRDGLDDLAALLEVLEPGDHALVDGALPVAWSLPAAERCDDLARLETAVRPGPAQAEAVAELRPMLTRVELLRRAMRTQAAVEENKVLIRRAREIGYDPLIARALVLGGRLAVTVRSATAEAELRMAAKHAAKASTHALEAEAMALLIGALASDENRLDEADALVPAAEAAAQRSADPRARALVAVAAAAVLEMRRQWPAAVLRLDEAVAALEELDEPPAEDAAYAHFMRARIEQRLERADEAAMDYARVESLIADRLGEEHPLHGTTLLWVGEAALQHGDADTAKDRFARARAVLERSLGPRSRLALGARVQEGRAVMHGGDAEAARVLFAEGLARCDAGAACGTHLESVLLENVAWAELITRHYEDSARHYERALELFTGAAHAADRSRLHRFLGYVGDASGDHAGAREHFGKMREAEVEMHGPKHEYVLWATNLAANSARYAGDCEMAREGYSRALRLRVDLSLDPGPYLAEAMLGLGECELADGRLDDARESLATAWGLRTAYIEPDIRAGIHFGWAKVLQADGKHAEARAEAEAAADAYGSAGVPRDAWVKMVEAWLEEHPPR